MLNYPSFFNGVSAPYQIEQSLRFNNSGTYLHRTPSSAGNRQTWTYSVWIKRCLGGTWPHYHGIFSANNYVGNDWELHGIEFGGTTFNINSRAVISQNTQYSASTENKFRDPSAWMHVVAAFNTTSATSSERLKIWVNGVLVTFTGSLPAQNFSGRINTTSQHRIGSSVTTGEQHCYMAEAHFVDGTALDHEDFGEFDDNGVWRPIEVSGLTYGTNGFYLKFDPSATNGIGHDHSGNGNNFTPVAFTTSGTGTDVMSDTPTTNYATLNPIDKGSAATLSDGNLIYSKGSTTWNNSGVRGTFAVSSGKWYWEITKTSATLYSMYGVATSAANFSEPYSAPNESWTYISDSGNKFGDGSGGAGTSYGATFTNGDVIGVALDMDAGTLVFYKNGTSQGTAFSTLSGETVFPWVALFTSGDSATCNFGQRDFAYTPPTGFKALNTSNLSAPDIADGSQYFNTVTYTGTGAALSITGVGFQPDFIWFKRRSHAENHWLQDAVRGVTKGLYSNLTDAEDTRTDQLQSFDSDGFSLGVDAAGYTNISTRTYAAWNWKAGNGTTNIAAGSIDGTNPTIASTVSANPSAGFSIVSYQSQTATKPITLGHGLGVKPSMIICKNRDGASSWTVYHSELGATKGIFLNSTIAPVTSADYWNNTEPTSTVFTVNDSSGTHAYGTSNDMIAYCFAEVEGYSKFGSYTGNGNADGPFVYCGFRPAWVLIKNSNSATDWHLFDTARDPSNEVTQALYPDTSGSEDTLTNNEIDILSNGFKPRSAGVSTNGSGNTLVFAAFAENPFGGSGISPATAR